MATSEAQKRAIEKWKKKNIDRLSGIRMANYWKMKIENPNSLREMWKKNNKKNSLNPKFKEKQRIRHRISELARRRGTHKPCEICESYKTEIHHQDYNDPYDIIWLCHKHHIQLHKLIKGTEDDPQILYER